MVLISTFVIFDIETTGLPREEWNRTKITELTFLAVHRQDIEAATKGCVPFVNKLSYLFNPKRLIQKKVSELTGLTNAALQNQPIFKNRIKSLIVFLEELQKPVCLVAHNGNSFDFKLLRSEFNDAGETLPSDLLCVDSLGAFRKILKETNLCHKPLLMTSTTADTSKPEDDLLTDDEEWPELNTTAEDWDEIDQLVGKITMLATQKSPKTSQSPVEPNKQPHVNVDRTVAIKNVFQKKPRQEKICCTLQALYKRFLDKEAVNAHRSEGDCVMLLECVVAVKKQFLTYANDKCKLISEVKPFERPSVRYNHV